MDRDAWIMAASLLRRHGADALALVIEKVDALEGATQSSWSADNAAPLMFWRQTGQAMLAIVEMKPVGPHNTH
jgi:hypothetical protein